MKIRFLAIILTMVTVLSNHAISQTSGFNFQGRMNDGTAPANGTYDLQFKLFNAIAGGSQIGTTLDRPGLVLINGVFSTALDFGGTAFNGAARFIEISVRPAGSPNAYIILGGRQQILAVPFAVRSSSAALADNATVADFATVAGLADNATTFGGLPASEYARLNIQNSGDLRISGNVAIGTSTPNTRLTLSGGPSWSSANWIASMNMQNAAALGWEANNAGQRFGIGQTNGGLHFFRTTSPFGSNTLPAQIDLVIADNGNLAQPLERNGTMKALLAVTANGTIVRCYNGVTGSTTGNCGFSVTLNGSPEFPAGFIVDFPFDVSGRFWMVTPERSTSGIYPQTAGVRLVGNNGLLVSIHYDGDEVFKPFHLFVF